MAKSFIDALLHEREGYELSGNEERIKQVDSALDEAGYQGPRDSAKVRAAGEKAAKRRTKETAVNEAPENTAGE